MDAKATWKHGLSFEGWASSGFTVNLGAAQEVGGENDGFRPMELLLVGLAGCTAMDVISILEKKRQQVTGFEVRAHAERANEHPKVFTEITLEYVVTGHNIDPEAVKRAVELSENKYCSAQAMLGKTANIQHKITILEG
ncbi:MULTISPECIES: OsmC family protein [Anaerolinea]|uniref:OsmC family protein n=1 Tax=Anaerolinea TaxID=233189 RepID=UPI00260C1230|nr:OsmC family protein [Anaerolinea thermophila]